MAQQQRIRLPMPANAGDASSISGSGNGNPLQYSCLENPMGEELGGLQSMWLQRDRHDSVTKQCQHVLKQLKVNPRLGIFSLACFEDIF